MHLGDYLRVKQSRRRPRSGSQGALLRFGNRESGMGEKLSRRLARRKPESAAAVRAWCDNAAETEGRAVLKRAGSDG